MPKVVLDKSDVQALTLEERVASLESSLARLELVVNDSKALLELLFDTKK